VTALISLRIFIAGAATRRGIVLKQA